MARMLLGTILFLTTAAKAAPDARNTSSTTDALPRDVAVLAEGLIEHGMPEVLESLLSNRARTHQVLTARAFVRAAAMRTSPSQKDEDLAKAEAGYRAALQATDSATWNSDLKRRFVAARWRVELADLILRQRCAADLDQLEATSGLAKASPALVQRLGDALFEYRSADEALTGLLGTAEREPDALLATGIGEALPALAHACALNLAWTLTFQAIAADTSASERARHIQDALRRFDEVAHRTNDPERKINSLIGAAVAFRVAGKPDDSATILESLLGSCKDAVTRTRVHFELGRTYLARREFARAVTAFSALTPSTTAPFTKSSAESFYVQLAPVLRAYARLMDAQRSHPPNEVARLEAREELLAIRRRGGAWPAICDLYLADATPAYRRASELGPGERRLAARKLMAQERYADALVILRELLAAATERPGSNEHELQLDVATCQMHTQRPEEALDNAETVARNATDADIADRATLIALDAARQLCQRTGLAKDYGRFVEVARRALDRTRDPTRRDALAIEAAQAARRAGRDADAGALLATVSSSSGLSLHAKAESIRLRHEKLVPTLTGMKPDDAARAARELADEWERVLNELERSGTTDAATRNDYSTATLCAAELLASAAIQRPDAALARLSKVADGDWPSETRAKATCLRLRCMIARRDFVGVQQWLSAIASQAASDVGLLLALGTELESQCRAASDAGHEELARQIAESSLSVMRQVCSAMARDPQRSGDIPIVEFGLARMLLQSDHAADALEILDRLVGLHPEDLNFRWYHARASERVARATHSTPDAPVRAERAWRSLLEDATLRDRDPACYWDARYHWLQWQLERGRAEEVARGIDAERVWYPELGGSPWKDRLLKLAEQARAQSARDASPAASGLPQR